MRWPRFLRPSPPARPVPLVEAVEPRLLFSADLAAGLLLASDTEPAPEQRTLDASGEYATAASFDQLLMAAANNAPVAHADSVLAVENSNAPTANDDVFNGTEDTPLTLSAAQLLGNDFDPEGDPFVIESVTTSRAVLNADGSVTFTPEADVYGPVTFRYRISDVHGERSQQATVTINLAQVDDPPVGRSDILTATEDTPVAYAASVLLGNDVDLDGDGLAIAGVTSGVGGTVLLQADGTVRFAPDANFHGTAAFTYRLTDGITVTGPVAVTVNVGPANDAPTSAAVVLPPLAEDNSRLLSQSDLLAHATDFDGDQLAAIHLVASSGTLVDNGNGTWTFTPASDDEGAVSFSYQISDGLVTVAGSASLDLTPVNDAPTAAPVTLAPLAEDGTRTITQFDLLANAADIDGGTLVATNLVSSSGTLVDNGNGTWTFTPAADDESDVNFTFAVSDGDSVVAGRAQLDLLPVNDAPRSTGDLLGATEDQPVTFSGADLLGNDSDTEGDPLRIGSVGQATGGTVRLNADGTVTFTPDANFHGAATFSYTASDGLLAGGAATVRVAVAPVPDAPVITSGGGAETTTVILPQGATAVTTVRSIDADGAGETLSYAIAGGADADRFVIDAATGALHFLRAPDEPRGGDADRDGVYEVLVQVSDGQLADRQAISVGFEFDLGSGAPPVGAPPAALTPAPGASPPPGAPGAAPAPPALAPAPPTGAPPAPPEDALPRAGAAPGRLEEALAAPPPGAASATPEAAPLGFPAEVARVPEVAGSARILQTIVFDREGIVLAALQNPGDLLLSRFGTEARGDGVQLEELQGSLRSPAFAGELDRLREAVREELQLQQDVTISVASVSLGLSLVYVLWLIRGGVLLGSYLSALPAWRILDPLPVLSRVDEASQDEDEPLEGGDDQDRNVLRGFG